MELSNQIYILNLNSLRWRKIFQKGLPEARENPIWIADEKEERLYLLGGNDKNEYFSLEKLYYLDLQKFMLKIEKNYKLEEQIEIEISWNVVKMKAVG